VAGPDGNCRLPETAAYNPADARKNGTSTFPKETGGIYGTAPFTGAGPSGPFRRLCGRSRSFFWRGTIRKQSTGCLRRPGIYPVNLPPKRSMS
jgi:hypothetical protein